MARPEDKGPPPGQMKQHEIINPATGEKQSLSQAELKQRRKELKAAGWKRVEEIEEVDPTDTSGETPV